MRRPYRSRPHGSPPYRLKILLGRTERGAWFRLCFPARLRPPLKAPPSLLAPSSLVSPVGAGGLWLAGGDARLTMSATRGSRCFARASLFATFVIMATRVRNQPARQPGVPAARTGAGGRGTSASYSPSSNKRKKKRPPQSRNLRRPRNQPRKPARSPDPVVILIGWIGRVLQGAWMALAGAVGWVAPSLGRGARGIQPHHRRDGVGRLTLGGAIMLARGLWLRVGPPARA